MLAIWICQREAVSSSFKWIGESSRLNKERKKSYAEFAKIFVKNRFLSEIVRKEKEIPISFAVTPQTAKVIATVLDEFLVKMEKVLNLYRIFRERETTFT